MGLCEQNFFQVTYLSLCELFLRLSGKMSFLDFHLAKSCLNLNTSLRWPFKILTISDTVKANAAFKAQPRPFTLLYTICGFLESKEFF